MNDAQNSSDETAVNDVRRVREAIARQHEGDLQAHVDETNRITENLVDKLKLRMVTVPPSKPVRNGTGG
jgi:hypothetical protein